MKRRPLFASVITSLAAILILAAGCGEQSPTATQLEPTTISASRGGDGGAIGRHAKMVKRHHRAGHFAQTIGRRGGTLHFGIGTLVIPPGALRGDVRITADVNGEDLAVQFQPHGLRFRRGHEPTLTFDYRGAKLDQSGLQVLYVDDSDTILETLSTENDTAREMASTRLQHFSGYLLGSW